MISVVIPVFNRPEAARRAVQSAAAQQGLPAAGLETIVVDDASAPPLELGDAGGELVRIVRLTANAGPAAARNAGIRASRGDHIAFLDSDDVWLPDKLAGQLRVLQQSQAGADSTMTAVTCGFYYPNRASGRIEARMPMAGRKPLEFASGCWSSPGTTLLVPRKAFEIVGPLDERLRRLEDYDWLLRFSLAGGQVEVADLFGAVIAPSGLARSDAVGRNAALLERKFGPAGKFALTPALYRRLEAYLALERGGANAGDGNWLKGWAWLLKSWLLRPRTRGALLPFWRRSTKLPPHISALYSSLVADPQRNKDVPVA